jgi:hypothetical protein
LNHLPTTSFSIPIEIADFYSFRTQRSVGAYAATH